MCSLSILSTSSLTIAFVCLFVCLVIEGCVWCVRSDAMRVMKWSPTQSLCVNFSGAFLFYLLFTFYFFYKVIYSPLHIYVIQLLLLVLVLPFLFLLYDYFTYNKYCFCFSFFSTSSFFLFFCVRVAINSLRVDHIPLLFSSSLIERNLLLSNQFT